MLIRSRFVCFFVSAVIGLGASIPAIAQNEYRIVAQEGDVAPGRGRAVLGELRGSLLTPFGGATINNAGHIAFLANLQGAGIEDHNRTGIWLWSDGVLSNVFQEGDQVPGAQEGHVFHGNNNLRPILSDNDELLIETYLIDSSTNMFASNFQLWHGRPGELERVFEVGGLAPGTNSLREITSISGYSQNRNGQVIISARIQRVDGTPGIANGIYLEEDGALLPIAVHGHTAVGLPDGTSFWVPSGGLNNAGQVLVSASYASEADLNNGHTSGRGLWLGTPAGVEPVIFQSQHAPGFPEDIVLFPFNNIRGLNDAGHITFSTDIISSSSGSRLSHSSWIERGNGPELLLLGGMQAPGIDNMIVDQYSDQITQLSNSGDAIVSALLRNADTYERSGVAIWLGTPGDLSAIWHTGQAAPGLPGEAFTSGGVQGFNDHSHVLIQATTNTNTEGLWLTDSYGILRPILLTGQLIDFNPDPEESELGFVRDFDLLGGFNLNNNDEVVVFVESGPNFSAIIHIQVDLPTLGDLDGNDVVGNSDLQIVLANWGQTTTAGTLENGDWNADGRVDGADLDAVLAGWTHGEPPEVNIPEPGSLALLGLGGLALLRRRR